MPNLGPGGTYRGGSGNWSRGVGGSGGGVGRMPSPSSPKVKSQNKAAKTYITKDPARVEAGRRAAQTRADNQAKREYSAKRAGVKKGAAAATVVMGPGGAAVGYLAGRNDEKRKSNAQKYKGKKKP